MPTKAMILASDSQNQAVKTTPRNERLYSLTPLGHQAVAWLKVHDPTDEEFAFFCPGCLRPLSKCSCPIDER
jgi:hypothetical protein